MTSGAQRRRGFLGASLGLLAAPGLLRAHSAWPDRPLRYVCPFPPGATNDNVARTMARALSTRLGVPVVVENRAGAGGAVGARMVAESPADGYTLLNASAGNLVTAPHLNAVGYDPLRDFAPVAMVGESFALFAVSNTLPVDTVGDFVAYARAHPGMLNYTSAGIGSGGHLRGALLSQEAGIEMVHVPYPGSAPAANSLLSGECHLLIDPVTAPHVQAGRLKALGTLAPVRWPAFPAIPTLAEQGFARDWPDGAWFGIFAPRGTPEAVVTRLNLAVNDALADEEVAEVLRRFGLRPQPLSPQGLDDRTRFDHAATGRALQALALI
jgi:tripartite-type tricarboxylate transporter receptor subunit TctC